MSVDVENELRPLRTRGGLPFAGLASRPYPAPRPEVGGYGHGLPSGWWRERRPGDGSSVPPVSQHRRAWRAVARTAQRPVLMVVVPSGSGLPPCWRYATTAPQRPDGTAHSPTLSIRQSLAGPTVRVLWGGRDQGRHDQLLLRRQYAAQSRVVARDKEYRRGQGEASGGEPGGWPSDGPPGHRFRHRAIDTATNGRLPRGEHGLRSCS